MVADRLRQAAAEGRLLAEELEHRLARALRARTYAELDPLVADLPSTRRAVQRRGQVPPVAVAVAAVAVTLFVLAVAAVVVMVLTGLAMVWGFWLVMAWFFLGRGRRAGMRSASRRRVSCGPHGQMRFAQRRSLL